MEGQGFLYNQKPFVVSLPRSSNTDASKPGMGNPTEHGFMYSKNVVLSIAPPISVPPERLISGHLPLPTLKIPNACLSIYRFASSG
jgi:hypothetical protein